MEVGRDGSAQVLQRCKPGSLPGTHCAVTVNLMIDNMILIAKVWTDCWPAHWCAALSCLQALNTQEPSHAHESHQAQEMAPHCRPACHMSCCLHEAFCAIQPSSLTCGTA
jgi:hypothetical protein